MRRLTVLTAVAATIVLFFVGGGAEWVTGDGNVERLLTETGVIGPIVFVLIMWMTQPLGIPGFVYMVPAGIVWPAPLAIALAWVGNMGASYVAFAFARWVAREWVTVRIPRRMHRHDDKLAAGGVRPIILIRLVFGQLPPADWLLGVTSVTTRNFLVGTGLGIIPGVVLFVVAGGGMVELVTDLPTSTRRIVIAVVVTLLVARRLWRIRNARRRTDELRGARPASEN